MPQIKSEYYIDPNTGQRYLIAKPGGTTNSNGDTAGNVVAESRDAVTGIQRYQITPTINGVATAEVEFDATATNSVLSAMAVFNALDIVTAGDAVLNRFPDVKRIELDESIVVQSTQNITKVWCLGFGTVLNTASNIIAPATTILTDIRAALLEFSFDAVDEVKTVEISLGTKYTSGASIVPSQYATLRVEGYSHA